MNCPIDGTSLQMTERQGVEIDYCPRCRGVWLDRGELDKIIARGGAGERAPEGPFYPDPRGDERDREHWDDEARREGGGRRRRKRESFLEDLFDF